MAFHCGQGHVTGQKAVITVTLMQTITFFKQTFAAPITWNHCSNLNLVITGNASVLFWLQSRPVISTPLVLHVGVEIIDCAQTTAWHFLSNFKDY